MSQIYDTFITKYVSNVVFDLASDFEILTMYIYFLKPLHNIAR